MYSWYIKITNADEIYLVIHERYDSYNFNKHTNIIYLE